MAKCPSCNKFCGLEMQDPEVQDFGVESKEENGIVILLVSGVIRIVRNSECCGDEIKEYTFDFADEFEIKGHLGEGHEFSIDEGDVNPTEDGGGRYKKSYYGVEWMPEITCSCGQPVELIEEDKSISLSDNVAASEMDDLT